MDMIHRFLSGLSLEQQRMLAGVLLFLVLLSIDRVVKGRRPPRQRGLNSLLNEMSQNVETMQELAETLPEGDTKTQLLQALAYQQRAVKGLATAAPAGGSD